MSRTFIDVESLREMLERGEPVTVLDVRPEDQRAEWQIPGSIHFDAYEALKAKDPSAMEEVECRPPERHARGLLGGGRGGSGVARVGWCIHLLTP